MATLTQDEFDVRLSQCKTLEDVQLLRDEVRKYIAPAEEYSDYQRAFRYYGWLGKIAERGASIQIDLASTPPEQPVTPAEPSEPVEPESPIIIVEGDVENGEWVEQQRETETDYPAAEAQEEFPNADR